ncbi:mitochondrial 54S ribosomal protein uL2m RML2 PWA37_002893 [Arxiozyma heterogenica]|uniref:mitochondrial 54S ribosomal protein uL2m RML2 n=1 Tax=Arxiozyma heterogenica TaxID=278026 RepID=UPI002EE6412D
MLVRFFNKSLLLNRPSNHNLISKVLPSLSIHPHLYSTTSTADTNTKENLPSNPNLLQDSLTPHILKIVPNTSDITLLEKQDELLRKRRKLAKETIKLKTFKPISPSLRWLRYPVYPHLHKGKPVRFLTVHKNRNSGRNNQGRITVRHRSGRFHKRRIRLVDFFRSVPGKQTVQRIEYDPGRTGHIALLKHNETGKLSYILACDGLRAGDVVESFRYSNNNNNNNNNSTNSQSQRGMELLDQVNTIQRGNCLPLEMIPIGTVIHNVGITPIGPAKFCRAAGTYARLLTKLPEKKKAVVRLQSGEHRYVSLKACATIGVVSNVEHQLRSLGKAGRSRWLGRRPSVRGVAMNKCDHPHGGGRGKSKSNKLSMSPWGQLAKGYKTRRGKNQNRMKVKDRPRGKK